MAYAFMRTMVQTRSKGHTATGAVCYRMGLASASTIPGADGLAAALRLHPADRHRSPPAMRPRQGPTRAGATPSPGRTASRRSTSARTAGSAGTTWSGSRSSWSKPAWPTKAIQAYADRLAEEHKTVVHFALHRPDRGGKNHHAHVLYPGRHVEEMTFARKRDRTQDNPEQQGDPDLVTEAQGVLVRDLPRPRHRAGLDERGPRAPPRTGAVRGEARPAGRGDPREDPRDGRRLDAGGAGPGRADPAGGGRDRHPGQRRVDGEGDARARAAGGPARPARAAAGAGAGAVSARGPSGENHSRRPSGENHSRRPSGENHSRRSSGENHSRRPSADENHSRCPVPAPGAAGSADGAPPGGAPAPGGCDQDHRRPDEGAVSRPDGCDLVGGRAASRAAAADPGPRARPGGRQEAQRVRQEARARGWRASAGEQDPPHRRLGSGLCPPSTRAPRPEARHRTRARGGLPAPDQAGAHHAACADAGAHPVGALRGALAPATPPRTGRSWRTSRRIRYRRSC